MDAKVVFETDRLLVRDWAESDGDRVFDIYRRWEVSRWLGADPRVMTRPRRGVPGDRAVEGAQHRSAARHLGG